MITINDTDRTQDFLHVDFFPNSALLEMVNTDKVLFVIVNKDALINLALGILGYYDNQKLEETNQG